MLLQFFTLFFVLCFQAPQESLSRTPSPFKKVDEKAERKPVKDRL